MSKPVRFIFLVAICITAQQAFAVTTSETPNQTAAPQNIIEIEANAREISREWNGDSLRRAIELYQNASDQWLEINNNGKAADCLLEAAQSSLLLGESREAVKLLKQALELDNRENDTAGKLKIYSLLSSAFLRAGNLKETDYYLKQAFPLSQSTNDSIAQSIYFTSLAETFYERQKFDDSVANYEKALSLRRQSGDLRGEAQTLLAFSYVYMSKGEPLTALKTAGESLAKYRETGDRRGEVLARIAVGVMNSKLDNKQIALDAFQQAEKLFPADVDFLERGVMYNSIAQIYESYGDLTLSLNYHLKAFDLFKKEQNPTAQLATLPSLGILTYKLGNEDSGLQYFNQGFQLADNLHDEYFHSILLEELGNLYFESDRNKSLGYYEQALPHFEKMRFRNRVALIEDNLGVISESRLQLNVARQYYQSSLQISREIKNKFIEAEAIYHLAKLDALEGNDESALKSAHDSIEITESIYSDVLNSKLKQIYFSTVFDRHELYINLLMKMHRRFPRQGFDAQALQASEKARARSMLETLNLAETNFAKDADPEIIRREHEIRMLLNAKSDRLTDALSSGSEASKIQKLDGEIRELENQLEQIKADLKQNSPVYSAIKNPSPFDAADFQNRILDDNSLFLEFSFGTDESYLWTIGKNEINCYVLPARRQIESRIETLRQLLAAREAKAGEANEDYQTRAAQAEKDYWREAQILSDELLGQISDKLGGKRLIIVPDGKLHYFPIAALPFPNSNSAEPILLTNETVYEPSASTLLVLAEDKKPLAGGQKNLLIFADPLFSEEDVRLSPEAKDADYSKLFLTSPDNSRFAESLDSLPRLAASKDEAAAITEIVGADESTLALGAEANRQLALNPEISRYRIIHFATHGYLNEERPELSGIVLSGFDENGNKQDGVIRLQDIYGLNLSADLVVLSACNTGIGKEVKGEGLMSLNNAFLQVGAKSVVSSLWKVDDYATQKLMKDFYLEMTSEPITAAEALRRAKIKMWRDPQYKSPFYWAAFTIEGNFQTAPKLVKSGGCRIYWLLLVLFLPAGIYLVRRRRRKSRLAHRKIINRG